MTSRFGMRFVDYRDEVVRHELGHWIVARRLGFEVGGIRIGIARGARGSFSHQGSASVLPMHPFPDLRSVRDYVEDRITILYAGVAAQAMFTPGIAAEDTPRLMATDGRDDDRKIEELLHIVRGIAHAGALSRENEWAHKREIADRCWQRACGLLGADEERLAHLVSRIGQRMAVPGDHAFGHAELEGWWQQPPSAG